MKQKRTFGLVVILVFFYCLYLIMDTGIDKVTIPFLLALGLFLLIRVILQFITKIHNTLKCNEIKFKIKIDKKSSNDEIIKLIEDYSKNKGEGNDNK